jgi:nucleotide-binding universal stress UspA family protein
MAPCTVNAYFMLHRFQTIVHPTDFSDTSALAFAHALRIALAMRSLLYIVHIAG